MDDLGQAGLGERLLALGVAVRDDDQLDRLAEPGLDSLTDGLNVVDDVRLVVDRNDDAEERAYLVAHVRLFVFHLILTRTYFQATTA